MNGSGSPNVTTNTGGLGPGEGDYSLTGFGTGSYTVSVSKVGGQNGYITSFDAARVTQHVTALSLLTTDAQKVTADTSGNGSITSNDAAFIARYVTALGPPLALAGQWRFFLPPGPTFPVGASPTSRFYSSVTSNISGDDYIGLLIGEVTGNWMNSGARPANGPERSTIVRAPHLVTPADNEVLIPVAVEGAANKGIISYEFNLRYDPKVIQPQADPVDLARTVSSGLSVVTNAEEAGLLRVAVYGPMPIDGNGLFLNLRFMAVGAPGSMSLLTWERLMFNEGDPKAMAADGQVELVSALPNQAEISGRLLNPMGQGVPNSRVTLTDTAGRSYSVISNGFGVYRFGALQVGQTYTISVESRRSSFTPLTVSVLGQITDVNMIAEP